ncbi:MAG: ArnT family glycosyltransferase [Chloroflexota bacterium]
MPIFVIFVFGAVILGAGAMLSPAWPTQQPRIGLAAALSLALVSGGTIFYASLFGWDILVIDYLMFALLTGIFLGGTLSYGQSRAEAQGGELLDEEQGWPGPQDLGFFAVVVVIFTLPVLVLPVPLGPSAQGYGFMALAMREGGSLNTFAPFFPEIDYLYSPAFPALTAYLAQQLNQGIHLVQFGVGAILALLNVWLAYDLGGEIQDKRLGRTLALVMLGSLGLFSALINGHYPALMGLAFVQAFIIYVLRYKRQGYSVDLVGAGLMLGAALLSNPGAFVIALLGFFPWLATMWLGQPAPDWRTWALLAVGVPAVALLATLPWIINSWDLLTAGLQSPFDRSVDNIIVMTQYHGLLVLPLVVLGGWLGWQQRDPVTLLALGWLFLIFDFSVTGGLAALFPFITRYIDPRDIAWHGPIIPYTILGGRALLWLWDTQVQPRLALRVSYRQTYLANGLLLVGLLLLAVFNEPVLRLTKAVLDGPGAYASAADIDALTWIKENTADDVRILNFPGPYEGDWVPVISERASVYFPPLPYARITPAALEEQRLLRDFWQDPADPSHEARLRGAGIALVIVPQVVAEPDSTDAMWRWRDPLTGDLEAVSAVADAPYLTPVYGDASTGAQVFQVNGTTITPPDAGDDMSPAETSSSTEKNS